MSGGKRPIGKGCTKCHDNWYTLFSKTPIRRRGTRCRGVPDVRVYQMSGCTKCQGVPNVRVYQLSGCTSCQGVPNVRVYQMSGGKKPIGKGCTKCHDNWYTLFSKTPIRRRGTRCQGVPNVRVYQLSGCTSCQGVPNVRVYQLSGCTSCQGVPNVRVYQMSGGKKPIWKGCTSCHDIWYTLFL